MRIRWKLTILLLAVSLVPLLVLKVVDAGAIARLSDRVVEQVTSTVTRLVEHELLGHVHRTAERMSAVRDRTEMITRTQAALFADAIGSAPLGEDAAPAIHTPGAFEDGAIPGLREQPGWPSGATPGPRVSYEVPVVLFPADEGPSHRRVAATLAGRVEMLDVLSSGIREHIRGQFVCLENGVHLSYPGRGGYPEEFDGRDRPWYARALEVGGVGWTRPGRDAITGETRLTCSAPVKDADGVLLGVTGVDVSLDEALEILELPPELALGASASVVLLDGAGGAEIVFARSDSGPSPDGRSVFESDDEAGLAGLIADLEAGRDGVVFMPRAGEPSVWAYGAISPDTGVVMIVPQHRVDALVEEAKQELKGLSQESVRTTAAAAIIVIGLVFVSAYGLARTISRPIRRLADAADAVGGGDLAARVRVRPRGDEIGKLARAFNTMVPALSDRLRLRESVELANELQQGLLPSESPEIPGFEVFGVSLYCDETGGDYFDYLRPVTLGEGRFGLVVGDVTGHGVPAALVMTSVRALLQSHAGRAGSPGELLGVVNETIARDAAQGRFITLQLVVLDTAAGVMRAANAGHDPGLIYRAETGVFDELPLGGLPLGVSPDERYQTTESPPPGPGDVLVIGTDGIWEMREPSRQFYGKERLREVVRRHASGTADEIGGALLADLDTFRAGSPRLDDVTFVILKAVG